MQRGALKITDLERINRKMQVAVAMATLRVEAGRLFTDEMLIGLAAGVLLAWQRYTLVPSHRQHGSRALPFRGRA